MKLLQRSVEKAERFGAPAENRKRSLPVKAPVLGFSPETEQGLLGRIRGGKPPSVRVRIRGGKPPSVRVRIRGGKPPSVRETRQMILR